MQKSRNLIFFNLSCRLRNIAFYHSWVSIHETYSIFSILGDPNSVATKRREKPRRYENKKKGKKTASYREVRLHNRKTENNERVTRKQE